MGLAGDHEEDIGEERIAPFPPRELAAVLGRSKRTVAMHRRLRWSSLSWSHVIACAFVAAPEPSSLTGVPQPYRARPPPPC